MFQELAVIHRNQGQAFACDNQWLLWQTCLRKVAFGPVSALSSIELLPGDQLLRGEEAYRLCLELICGLHSPLVGETEVLGQFKIAAETWVLPENPFGVEMRRFIRFAFEDAKKIRSNHLADLGSQSYGSLLRRELKGTREIHVIGGGHLTGEILPWISKDGISVFVHVRNPERAKELIAKSAPRAKVCALNEFCVHDAGGALVIAAPVSAEWVNGWLAASPMQFSPIIDLRGESATDPLHDSHGMVLDLAQVMARISMNQEFIERKKAQALESVTEVLTLRLRAVEYRPFGWEDVCA